MPSEPPPLPGRPPLPVLADFGDWLSPMIVKELRQGLRTWIFVGAFIVLQAVLVMTLMISSSSGNEEAASYFFWMLVAFILVFIVPLRGLQRTGWGDQRSDAGCAGVDAAQRVPHCLWQMGGTGAASRAHCHFGAAVCGAALFRWWSGSAQRVARLVSFLDALGGDGQRGGGLLGAALGDHPDAPAVGDLVVGDDGVLVSDGVTMRWEELGFFGGTPPESFWLVLFFVLIPLWIYGCYFVIDMGASTIAPIAANHATRKRLISLAPDDPCPGGYARARR